MRKSRFPEAQIVAILKELDAGTPATDLVAATASTPTRLAPGKPSTGGVRAFFMGS